MTTITSRFTANAPTQAREGTALPDHEVPGLRFTRHDTMPAPPPSPVDIAGCTIAFGAVGGVLGSMAAVAMSARAGAARIGLGVGALIGAIGGAAIAHAATPDDVDVVTPGVFPTTAPVADLDQSFGHYEHESVNAFDIVMDGSVWDARQRDGWPIERHAGTVEDARIIAEEMLLDAAPGDAVAITEIRSFHGQPNGTLQLTVVKRSDLDEVEGWVPETGPGSAGTARSTDNVLEIYTHRGIYRP